jgi:DNA-3-methyladenine glycosylase I
VPAIGEIRPPGRGLDSVADEKAATVFAAANLEHGMTPRPGDSAAISLTSPAAGLFSEDGAVYRCWWCQATPAYRHYHDTEWGFPVDDERRLFEKICLEGFQAGLSWLTILNKRENFRRAFANFEAERVAHFDGADVQRLVKDAGIIRHAGKIASAINNARRVIELRREFGSLGAYVWKKEPDPASRPPRITHEVAKAMPTSPASVALSKDLKKRGWTFVGPTTMYAFMQAMGLVNDHLEGCASRDAALRARAAFKPPQVS